MIGLFDNPCPTTSLSYPDAYRRAADPSAPEDFQPLDRAPTDRGITCANEPEMLPQK